MNGQQPPQQPGYGQQYAPPQYVQTAPHQPFKLPKMIGYILIMIAVIFIPIGMMIAINASGSSASDTRKLGANIEEIGILLAAVFTMLFLGVGADLDKFEKLGLLLFLAVLVSAGMGVSLGSIFG